MKKALAIAALAATLIIGGGTGVYMVYAKGNISNPTTSMMPQQGVNVKQMTEMMKSGNTTQMTEMMKSIDPKQMEEMMKSGDAKEMQQLMKDQNITFDQMKPYMQKMHPGLSDQQLEDLYNSMHGTGGACSSQNGQGMMQNTSTKL
jgi:hypothetical protein